MCTEVWSNISLNRDDHGFIETCCITFGLISRFGNSKCGSETSLERNKTGVSSQHFWSYFGVTAPAVRLCRQCLGTASETTQKVSHEDSLTCRNKATASEKSTTKCFQLGLSIVYIKPFSPTLWQELIDQLSRWVYIQLGSSHSNSQRTCPSVKWIASFLLCESTSSNLSHFLQYVIGITQTLMQAGLRNH